jgi:hypothetical protein
MTSAEAVVQYYSKEDLSGEEIKILTRKEPVIYSDLAKYKSVQQLLGKENYCVIMYQTSSRTTGHFVALYMRYDGVLCFADSYGIRVDTEQQYGASYDDKIPKYLSNLIEKSGLPYEENKVDYQSKSSRISTCGRFASFFCIFGRDLQFREIQDFLTTNQDSFLKPDNIVTMLTLFPLREIRQYYDKFKPHSRR